MVNGGAVKGSDLLKLGRQLRQLTQDEVAELYGVSLSTYWRWERGLTAVPYDDLCAICSTIFKLELDYLRGMADAA